MYSPLTNFKCVLNVKLPKKYNCRLNWHEWQTYVWYVVVEEFICTHCWSNSPGNVYRLSRYTFHYNFKHSITPLHLLMQLLQGTVGEKPGNLTLLLNTHCLWNYDSMQGQKCVSNNTRHFSYLKMMDSETVNVHGKMVAIKNAILKQRKTKDQRKHKIIKNQICYQRERI